MALDKLVDSSLLDGALENTADAIREKTGGSSSITFDYDTITNVGFADAIGTIVTLEEGTASDTATSGDILSGKTAHVQGELVTGNIPTKTGENISASGKTVTVPSGYYAQQYTKDIATGSATTPATAITANPTISVGSNGLITATVTGSKSVTPTVSAGYVSTGTAGTVSVSGSAESQLSVQASKTVTPTESEQTAVASGKYTTGAVKVGAISSTYVGSGIDRNDSDDLSVSGATVTAPTGYYAESASASVANGSVTQNAPTVNSTTGLVTATSTVTAGYVGADTKSNTLQLSTQGTATITPSTSAKTAVAAGKYTTGKVSVAGDADLVAGNIKKGVDIFGVTGTFTTTPSGKTALTAAALRSGYAGFINGSQVNGSMADTSVTEGKTTVSTILSGWENGSFVTSTGENYTTTGAIRNQTFITPEVYSKITCSDGYGFILYAWNKNTGVYIGAYKNSGVFNKADGDWKKATEYELATYPDYKYKVALYKTNITTAEGNNCIFWENSATRGEWNQTAGYTTARTIEPATFANTATTGTTYVDISSTTEAPVLVSGGYMYINKGWTDDLKISLAKLVPDGASANLASGVILSGYSAYNNDGTLIAGNIPTKTALTVSGKTVTAPAGYYASNTSANVATGTVISGSASITSLTKTYNSTSGKFDITGSADVSAPSVGTAGYISSSEGTRNKNTGGATVSTTIDKIVGTASISATTKKPSITKRDVPSGVTQAASGNATTTAPTTGVYVAVKSDANTATLTPSVSITTDGYGDSTNHGITASGASVGAAASDTTYIPITTTTASVSGKTVSYGSGWITEGSKSVADGAYSASVSSHSVTTTPVVTGSLSGTVTNIGTTTKPSSGTDGTDYWTITPSGSVTTTGVSTAKGKATIGTAGYIATGNKESSASTVNITPTVSAGTARYLTKAVIAGSSTNATATTTVAPGTVSISKQSTPSGVTNAASGNATTTAPSSGVYVAVKATAAANSTGTTSSISGSGSATVSTAGYAPTTLTGSVSVSGTATAKTSAKDSSMTYVPITTASPTFSSPTPSGGSTATGTNATLNSTDNGIKIQTAYTVSQASVTYNAAVNGWVTKTSGTEAVKTTARGSTNGTAYYIQDVTIVKPSSGNRTFSVIAPDKSATNHTYLYTTDSTGDTTIKIDNDLTMQWNATDESLDFIYT